MKYLVVSDIHGLKESFELIEKINIKEHIDKIILLGDLYHHSFSSNYEGAEILNKYKGKILCTKGNCDSPYDIAQSEFEMVNSLVLNIKNKTFFFTHGHKFNIDNEPSSDFDVLVYGHFHTGFIKEKNGKIFVNAGSISLPKNDTPNSFLIITDEEIILKDIDENIIDKIKI